MSHYQNLNVAVHYDLLITLLAIMFFIHWILAKVQITRLTNVFRRDRQIRNKQICAPCMSGGIEKDKAFRCDIDRSDFLDRLAELCLKGNRSGAAGRQPFLQNR